LVAANEPRPCRPRDPSKRSQHGRTTTGSPRVLSKLAAIS
jgi:hypothetical protein